MVFAKLPYVDKVTPLFMLAELHVHPPGQDVPAKSWYKVKTLAPLSFAAYAEDNCGASPVGPEADITLLVMKSIYIVCCPPLAAMLLCSCTHTTVLVAVLVGPLSTHAFSTVPVPAVPVENSTLNQFAFM